MVEATTAAMEHYENNAAHYSAVESRLAEVRETYTFAPLTERVARAKLSYCFAVMSIQTSVDRHEEAFAKLAAGESLETALESVNYNQQKMSWIQDSLSKDSEWEQFVRLSDTDVDAAHKFLIDNFKGVSSMKAAFTLAMLGFTEKMCIDTNVQSLCGIEKPTTVVVSRYENVCSDVKEQFADLSDEVSPFLLQWILFSFNRKENGRLSGNVDHHTIWFDTFRRPGEDIVEIVSVP